MITFKINNIDISNDVMLDTFNYMKRIDEVFGTGKFQFESKIISENIAPYSILQINDDYYCCSSEATYHFGKQSWFHNVSIIEAISLLSRFLVGSKAFSITGTNQVDCFKIEILIKLINDKYGVNIKFDNIQRMRATFNKQIEYVFTAGTTLFDSLNEISKQYNQRFYVLKIEDDGTIVLDHYDLTNLNTIQYETAKVLSITKLQNSETYCKYLENEATNVIDTGELNVVKNLFPTANDIKVSEDTLVLKLPTPAFKVEKVIARMPAEMSVSIEFYEFPEQWVDEEPENNSQLTYRQWVKYFPVLKDLYTNIFSKYEYEGTSFYDRKWIYDWKMTTITLVDKEMIYLKFIPLLSKEQYDLTLDKNKPDYVYYTSGSNIIDGFANIYKNDFWNSLIGANNTPVIFDLISDTTYQGYSFDNGQVTKFEITNGFTNSHPMDSNYIVEYYPIANPYLINTKQDTPINESNYKPYSISYNKSSNFVDFDKIVNSMNIENQSMGKPELIIEYDTTGFKFGFDLARKIIIDDNTWYIISSETTYTNGKQTTTFNLVSNYNKVADVVSLNSQYNTLKNPLENIIERPLFFETNESFNFVKGVSYLKIATYDSNDNLINTIYKQPVILNDGVDKYLYCEMLDQYSAGTNVVEVTDNLYKVNDVSYVDSNNEATSIRIGLYTITPITLDEAKKLPEYNGANAILIAYIDRNKRYVYKDAREKLTFTIKANNCIIK